MKYLPILFGMTCILFLTGCTLDFPTLGKGKGPHTPTIGGRGVVVIFEPGKPPLNEIDGPFSIGLKFLNYNQQEITISPFTIGSTLDYPTFPLSHESVSLSGVIFTGANYQPGEVIDYRGEGTKLNDKSIHYGDFYFSSLPPGTGTQFYVDMDISYQSVFPFQFCAYDLQSPSFGGGCSASETISGVGRLGIDFDAAPVIVSSIKKTLTSDRSGIKIQLDITLKDTSVTNDKEQRSLVKQDVGQQLLEIVSFDLASLGGNNGNFVCTSDTQLQVAETTTLDVYFRNKEAKIRCVGYTSLLEERFDLQYQITLEYPYHQRVSTPYIPLRTTQQRQFS